MKARSVVALVALPLTLALGTCLIVVEARSQDGPKPTCIDNQKNGDETDVDCGGPKCPKCAFGKACAKDSDCAPGACVNSACDYPTKTPTCTDSTKNGDETDVDCGGPKCSKCDDAKACSTDGDCKSGLCKASVCTAQPKAPTCWDNEKNGDESDVDCGGPKCPGCAVGKACNTHKDCRSKMCSAGKCGE